jgi:uncharacterized protein
MNENIKNVLGGAIVITVLLAGYAAVRYVGFYGESIQPSSFRSFSVTGDGKATGIPDVAEFSFQVITQGGKDVTSLQSQNTTVTNKVIAFVKSAGVDEKDIKTQYYNVEPRYQTYDCRTPIVYATPSSGNGTGGSSGVAVPSVSPCPPASIVGYTVTQSVDIKVRNFAKIGDIMGGVVTNGANQVGALSFTLDDPTKVQDEARAEAITKAKAKAESVAQAGGFRIGRLLGIQEGYNSYPMYDNMKALGAGMNSAAVAAPTPVIQPGSQEVDVSVTMQYEIQ